MKLGYLWTFGTLVCLALGARVASRCATGDVGDDGGCTTAVIAGSATANGWPLLWKNRDTSQLNQEIVYFNDGQYDYVTITNAGDSTQAWGGLNSAGFAIEDANNRNTSDDVPGPDDDGFIIKLALQTCQTAGDFQAILDSTSVVGHTRPTIYGVIDAQGGAAMFETFSYSYVRYDADDPDDAPNGILVRSNYSYAGDSTGWHGVYRHDRAKALIEAAASGDTLDVHYMCRTVARDLRTSDSHDPYPLPYEGQHGGLPCGWIYFCGGISNRYTVSTCVVEGVSPGENPLLATFWAFPMATEFGVALPFWVAAGTTPPQVNGDATAPLCDEGLRLKALALNGSNLYTYMLVDGYGGGLHNTTFPLEDSIFAHADSALACWRTVGSPDPAAMTALTAQFAGLAHDTLSVWPQAGDLFLQPRSVDDLTVHLAGGQGVVLCWSAVREDVLGLPITPSGYAVWRCENYPSSPGSGDSLGFAVDTFFVVPEPIEEPQQFFEVRTVRQWSAPEGKRHRGGPRFQGWTTQAAPSKSGKVKECGGARSEEKPRPVFSDR